MNAVRQCIYCNLEKSDSEFSLEHIWPDKLGGALCSSLFKTRDVCKRCNNVAGVFIDGAFIKSAFLALDQGTSPALRAYVDPRITTTTLPLSYIGVLDGVAKSADETCELWIGACGVQYFHLHQRDDSRWDSFTGGNPIARNTQPGRVFIIFTTAQADWFNLALRSGMKHFPKARRYGVNVELRTKPGAVEFLHQMDDSAKAEAAQISALPNEKQTMQRLDVAFEQRFMAKLALGLGHNIFGVEFSRSDYAQKLRDFMRAQTPAERAEFDLRGLNYLEGGKDPTSEHIAFKGGFTIRIMAAKNELLLSVNLPSGRVVHLVMADSPALWADDRFRLYQYGAVFIVVPQVGRFAGPIKLADYVTHRLGRVAVPELEAIEALRVNETSLPSCDG